VLCPSSEFLYQYYGTSLGAWTENVILELRKHTNRPIVVRPKALMPKDDIDAAIHDAWCVVTHVSAAALDALRLGVPIITTGACAASPLATAIDQVESPVCAEGRDELFSLLAHSQFTPDEMLSQDIIQIIDRLFAEIN